MPQRRGRMAFAAGVAAGFAAAGAVFAAAGLGAVGGNFTPQFFFGAHMVRAEAVVKTAGATYDFRLDRGKVSAVTPTSITLTERTGDVVTIPVAATATIKVNQRRITPAQVKKGWSALVVRQGADPAAWIQLTRGAAGGG